MYACVRKIGKRERGRVSERKTARRNNDTVSLLRTFGGDRCFVEKLSAEFLIVRLSCSQLLHIYDCSTLWQPLPIQVSPLLIIFSIFKQFVMEFIRPKCQHTMCVILGVMSVHTISRSKLRSNENNTRIIYSRESVVRLECETYIHSRNVLPLFSN